jgi:hypothetical protein
MRIVDLKNLGRFLNKTKCKWENELDKTAQTSEEEGGKAILVQAWTGP